MSQPSKEVRKRYDSKPEVREKQRLALKKRRKENPEKYREMGRKSERRRKLKTYGITEDEYISLLLSQKNLCAICKQPNQTKRDWHIDHCHTTGKVRGILCHYCNTGLGQFKDNKGYLLNAIEYLSKFD